MQGKEANNFKVDTEWTQEWMSPKRIQENKYLNIQEVVRGPFSSPRLLTVQPRVSYSSCQREAKYAKSNCIVRHGIPDTWREYLAMKGLCGTAEAYVLQKYLIPSCVRCLATNRLWNDIGLPFIQGIPDPWKSRSLHQSQPIKCLRRRSLRRKNISTQIAYIYDGDDEAEIECSVKCPFNKDHVDSKKDAPQTGHRESNFPLIQPEVLQMYEDNLKGIKNSKHVRQLPLNKNAQLLFDKKSSRKILKDDFSDNVELKKTVRKTREIIANRKASNYSSSKSVIHKTEKLDEKKQFLPKKRRKKSNETIVKKNIPSVPIETINEAIQTSLTMEDKVEQVKDSLHKSHIEANTQRYPNIVCCNCMLQNYMIPNIRYCSNFVNPLRGVNLSNRVLCQDCENVYCKSSTKKVKSVPKTISFCTSDPRFLKRKSICKYTKLKFCTCMQKARKRFEELNRIGHRIKTKSTIVSKQELKLMCYRCNSSYLKIAPIHANDAGRKTRSYICKKPSNKMEKERNRSRDCVTKYSTTRRRRNIVRGSKKCGCTCVENKRHVSKRGLERTSHSTIVKWRNDVAKRDSHEFLGENNCDDRLKKETEEMKVEEIQKDVQNVSQYTQSFPDSKTLNKKYDKEVPRDYYCGTIKGCKNKKNKINDSTMCYNEEIGVTQFPCSKSDKTMWYSVSDSGEYADISDNIGNVGFNVTAQDKLSVTSLTFIRRLNTTLIRGIYRRKKLRTSWARCVSSTDTLNEQALKIGKKRICTNRNCHPNRMCNNIFYSTVGKKGKAVMSAGTLIRARKSRRNKATLKYRIM
ncbi:hypothetical protein WH47_11868 [Habropoda laboriosa]|uniref:Uncharacterized protein n=1 Tax=Habropoda laboriosa TaxID=597456 RepID=A0A0L7R8W4_9HYME|nr:hypothetical protein WH47_11868 [Habropoda laboriosa]